METQNRNIKKIEFKATGESFIELAVKDVDLKTGVVCGYFAAFNNIDNGYDRILKGAFKKTIQERGPNGTKQIKHIKQHDQNLPIGYINILKEDEFGLYFESKMSATELGQDVLLQYHEKIYNEHSIGYRVMKEARVEDSNSNFICWDLSEIKLWEGSTVLWGMNDNTPVTALKSLSKEDQVIELDKRMSKCLAILKVGALSDETLEKAEIELLKLNEMYKSLITIEPQNRIQEPKRLDNLTKLHDILTIKK